MSKKRQRVRSLLVVAAVAVASTTSAYEPIRPGPGTWSPFDYINVQMSDEAETISGVTLDNPCTAARESIVFEGSMQLTKQVGRLLDGRYRVWVKETTSIQGTDALGNVMSASGSSVSDVTYGPAPITLLKYKKMNTPDAFHAVFVLDYEPLTTEFTVTLQADCGNGLP